MKNIFKSFLIFISALMFISIAGAQVPANIKKMADTCNKGKADDLSNCYSNLKASVYNLEITKYNELQKLSPQETYYDLVAEQREFMKGYNNGGSDCGKPEPICHYKFIETRIENLDSRIKEISINSIVKTNTPLVKSVIKNDEFSIAAAKCDKAKNNHAVNECYSQINGLERTINAKYVELVNLQPTREEQLILVAANGVYRRSLRDHPRQCEMDMSIKNICEYKIMYERLDVIETGLKDAKTKGYKN